MDVSAHSLSTSSNWPVVCYEMVVKEQDNMLYVFEGRNVSELQTNGNTTSHLKYVQLFINIYFRNQGHKTFR